MRVVGLGNDPTARILKPRGALRFGWRWRGLGNDPTARILKRQGSGRARPPAHGLGNDPTARILKQGSGEILAYGWRRSRQRSNSEDTETRQRLRRLRRIGGSRQRSNSEDTETFLDSFSGIVRLAV